MEIMEGIQNLLQLIGNTLRQRIYRLSSTGYGASHLGDIQKPSGHSLGQLALGVPVWAEKMNSRGPFPLKPFCDIYWKPFCVWTPTLSNGSYWTKIPFSSWCYSQISYFSPLLGKPRPWKTKWVALALHIKPEQSPAPGLCSTSAAKKS